jgi:hypothetical protein
VQHFIFRIFIENFQGLTKILVGVGVDRNEVEIIDLENSALVCDKLPIFPEIAADVIGVLGWNKPKQSQGYYVRS